MRTELYKLLKQRAGLEVVSETADEKKLRLICRLGKDRFNFWVLVMARLLRASITESIPWTCDISKLYVLTDDGSGVRYAWRVIFQTSGKHNLDTHIPSIMDEIAKSPRPASVDVSEMLLPGYRPGQTRSGISPRGKGASSVLNPSVGPMAVARLNQGGQ